MLISVIRYLRDHHVALLALFVALGGTAYAANTVAGRDVVDGSLKGKDLKNDTIQGRDVEADALKGVHIDESTLNAAVSSATVLATGEGPSLQFEDGFESVSYLGTGLYELTLTAGNRTDCNFASTFLSGGIAKSDNPATSISVTDVNDGKMAVLIRGVNGDLVDLGGDSGAQGFSLLSTC